MMSCFALLGTATGCTAGSSVQWAQSVGTSGLDPVYSASSTCLSGHITMNPGLFRIRWRISSITFNSTKRCIVSLSNRYGSRYGYRLRAFCNCCTSSYCTIRCRPEALREHVMMASVLPSMCSSMRVSGQLANTSGRTYPALRFSLIRSANRPGKTFNRWP
uniref:(northern house mosquito) hypothetical protein n=1 Tax=Culex pipiens TaxID=7175 RepID=A0A8D8MX02_CULPI